MSWWCSRSTFEENPRPRKPVYVDGDIHRTFLRKVGRTSRAAARARAQFARRDRRSLGHQPFTRVSLDETFHSASLKWYRDRYHATNPGFDIEQLHHEFLYEGYLVRENGQLLPMRGAVALFGSLRGVRNVLPKPCSSSLLRQPRRANRYAVDRPTRERGEYRRDPAAAPREVSLLHAQVVQGHRPGDARAARRDRVDE